MTMHCSARAVGHAGAGDTYQEAGSTTPARVPAIRAAHRLLKGSVGRHCDAITPAVGTSKPMPYSSHMTTNADARLSWEAPCATAASLTAEPSNARSPRLAPRSFNLLSALYRVPLL